MAKAPIMKDAVFNRAAALVILIGSGILGNYLSIPLFLGVDFLFGSIATLIILSIFGITLGTLSALIISSYTLFLWGHSYAIIIFVLEALIIGIIQKKFRLNLVQCAGIFWLIIGLPLIFLFYKVALGMSHSAVMIICLKQTVNGIFNALLASMALTFIPYKKWIPHAIKSKALPLRLILFDVMITLVLLPVLAIMVIEGRTAMGQLEKHIVKDIDILSKTVTVQISSWMKDHMAALDELVIFANKVHMSPSESLQRDVQSIKQRVYNFQELYIVNEKGISIAHTPLLNSSGETNIGRDFSDSDTFKTMLRTQSPIISDIFIEASQNFPTKVVLGAPVLKVGVFSGYVMGTLNLSKIKTILKQSVMAESYIFTLTDGKHRVIASTHDNILNASVYIRPEKGREKTFKNSVYRWSPTDQSLPTMIRYQRSWYVKETPLFEPLKWKLIIEYPISLNQKLLFALYSRNLAITLFMVMLSFLSAAIISKKLTGPLTQLAKITYSFHQPGSAPAKIPDALSNTPIKELQHLVKNFKAMSHSIEFSFLKLKEKKAETDGLNHTLEVKIAELEHIEGTLIERTYDLGERVKELNCLYNLSEILETHQLSDKEIIRKTLELIPPSWQYPEITCARITLNDQVFETNNFKKMPWMQQSDIKVSGHTIGSIDVGYLEERSDDFEGPFSKDERALIDTIAQRVGHFLERNKAEVSLEESRRTLMTVFDSIDATIYVADMQNNELLFINKQLRDRYALDVTGQTCRMALSDKNGPCDPCSNESLLGASGTPAGVCTWEGRSEKDGKWYINHARAIKWIDGRYVRLQISTDITRNKKLEKQLLQSHKMEAIGTLAGGIAHDFNNILGSMLGFTGLAIDSVEKGSVMEDNLQEVYRAGNRAKDLVKQILTFARQVEEDVKPIKVSAIAKEVLKLLRSSIPSTIDIKQEINSHSLIMGDPTRVHQIFMNIITNATQAIEDSGILIVRMEDVQLTGEKSDELVELKPGPYLKITISDTGNGISPEILNLIFEPYFTTKDLGEGTGMGLAVVQSIVKGLNGEIRVESQVFKGTTFFIYLPITQRESKETPYKSKPLPKGNSSILFVDDELPMVKIGKRTLGRLGYTVTTCTSSIEALELFRSAPDQFDLVITDLTMPHLTGEKLALAIREIKPKVPIIICTGYSKKFSKERARELEINAFIMKPISHVDLAVTVSRILAGKE